MKIRLNKSSIIALALMVSSWAYCYTETACGKTPVKFSNPQYFTTPQGIIVFSAPNGWHLDSSQHRQAYLIKDGETYERARALIYMAVEPLEVSLEQAAKNDTEELKSKCAILSVTNLPPATLMDGDCDRVTQMFDCNKPTGSYIDLDTKIAFNGVLLNIVLSGDKKGDITDNQEAYTFLLRHVTLVK
jgi:hypothetical protein